MAIAKSVCHERRPRHDPFELSRLGLEVAFIVVTFGTAGSQLAAAAIGAALAGLLVLTVGVAVRRPLANVPENQMKFGVGLMLVSFGTFWAGEGVGIDWVGSDLAILLLLVGYPLTSLLAVRSVAGRLAWPRHVSQAQTQAHSGAQTGAE
jgi:uncharacterized membrane protein